MTVQSCNPNSDAWINGTLAGSLSAEEHAALKREGQGQMMLAKHRCSIDVWMAAVPGFTIIVEHVSQFDVKERNRTVGLLVHRILDGECTQLHSLGEIQQGKMMHSLHHSNTINTFCCPTNVIRKARAVMKELATLHMQLTSVFYQVIDGNCSVGGAS